jgi:hypothetical protein
MNNWFGMFVNLSKADGDFPILMAFGSGYVGQRKKVTEALKYLAAVTYPE